METCPVHLVIRFSDTLFGVGDVVSLHNEVVNQYGAVWFGKLGKTISPTRIEGLNKQIEKNVVTFLYLVKGQRKGSIIYKASILAVSNDFPTKERPFIPSYYLKKKLLEHINVWFKLGYIEQVEMSTLKKLRSVNSVITLEETLSRSFSGYFLVQESNSKP